MKPVSSRTSNPCCEEALPTLHNDKADQVFNFRDLVALWRVWQLVVFLRTGCRAVYRNQFRQFFGETSFVGTRKMWLPFCQAWACCTAHSSNQQFGKLAREQGRKMASNGGHARFLPVAVVCAHACAPTSALHRATDHSASLVATNRQSNWVCGRVVMVNGWGCGRYGLGAGWGEDLREAESDMGW